MTKLTRAAAAIAEILVLPMLLSCAAIDGSASSPTSAAQSRLEEVEEIRQQAKETQISAWVAYWDQESALDELTALQKNLDAVCHFSAVFDEKGRLSIPEATTAFYQTMRKNQSQSGPLHYLTAVNDVVYANRPSSQKDTDVLKLLLANTQSRAAHIQELLELTMRNGYDGLEIDYETLHRQKGLAEKFALFCSELWEAAAKEELRIRVVLEPTFPVDTISLPQGPEYVIMFYNLYGYHSGPGPKADAAFIRETAEKMRKLPGTTINAFSTGGFDWSEDGSIQALNESQAQKLLATTGASAERDPNSGCLFYSYTGEEGVKHTVWFADGKTLNYWMDVAVKSGAGNQFVLWRLGGNNLSSLRSLE